MRNKKRLLIEQLDQKLVEFKDAENGPGSTKRMDQYNPNYTKYD